MTVLAFFWGSLHCAQTQKSRNQVSFSHISREATQTEPISGLGDILRMARDLQSDSQSDKIWAMLFPRAHIWSDPGSSPHPISSATSWDNRSPFDDTFLLTLPRAVSQACNQKAHRWTMVGLSQREVLVPESSMCGSQPDSSPPNSAQHSSNY